MKAWWAGLPERERQLLGVTGAVLLAFLYWLLVWRPLVASDVRAEQRLAGARQDLTWMQAADLEAARLEAEPTLTGNRGELSLLALAERTGRAAGLGAGFRRGEPVGEDRLRVTLEGVSFDAVARWLQTLEQRYGVVAAELSAERSGAPGLVNARLLLVE